MKKTIFKTYCNSCNNQTNHNILLDIPTRELWDPEGVQVWESWKVLQCGWCEDVLLLKEYLCSEDIDYDHETWEVIKNLQFFPRRLEDGIPYKYQHSFPNNIRNIYREVIETFNNHLNILCAAWLRAVVEGVCKDRWINDWSLLNEKWKRRADLQSKIEGLKEKQILTEAHARILHELRFLWNDAIHDLSEPSQTDLRIAIQIIEHTLENIYELPRKAKVLANGRK